MPSRGDDLLTPVGGLMIVFGLAILTIGGVFSAWYVGWGIVRAVETFGRAPATAAVVAAGSVLVVVGHYISGEP